MAIDPSKTFGQLVTTWNAGAFKLYSEGQGFWHAGNTLDTYVNYLVAAKQKDDQQIVSMSQSIFQSVKGTPDKPIWWRDDYGWWGISFLNAVANATALNLGADLVARCTVAADECSREFMNTDWEATGHHGVRNDPNGGEAEPRPPTFCPWCSPCSDIRPAKTRIQSPSRRQGRCLTGSTTHHRQLAILMQMVC